MGTPEQPTTSLEGGVAIVTGAGQGLGRVEALALAAGGAKVVLNDMSDKVEDVADEIRAAGGEATVCRGDVGDWNFTGSLIDTAVKTYGSLSILVNNAGFTRDKMIFSMTEDAFDDVVRVHLKGHMGTCRAATAHWREASKAAGGPVWASIINTASESFLFGAPGQPNYSAAKAGIVAITLSIAQSCAKYGVRANALAPRARTAMTEPIFGPAPTDPEGGMDPISVDHIAPVVAWLASPAAAHVTGQVLLTYGGKVAIISAPSVEATFASGGITWTPDELAVTLGAELEHGDHPGFGVPVTLKI
ncbi:MAG TPA: SDR family NAD(P)-dependent oxidoreductase [Frankiaceae bacterium]|jgi:NAD(P)-dependent dehydrogenase (short-subunit alcohol dehydrogenase family)|nr:SDR family NAD(P)-dependent oxidoreductase [Frankiaceae bacterium]